MASALALVDGEETKQETDHSAVPTARSAAVDVVDGGSKAGAASSLEPSASNPESRALSAPSKSASEAAGEAAGEGELDEVAELEQELVTLRLRRHFVSDQIEMLAAAAEGGPGTPESDRASPPPRPSSASSADEDSGYVPFDM